MPVFSLKAGIHSASIFSSSGLVRHIIVIFVAFAGAGFSVGFTSTLAGATSVAFAHPAITIPAVPMAVMRRKLRRLNLVFIFMFLLLNKVKGEKLSRTGLNKSQGENYMICVRKYVGFMMRLV
jgi:hypothetical protein